MAEQHENMQQQHHQQGQHITAQILNVQGGVATLGDSTPIQIMMPTGVVNVMDEHQQVPHHVQEMQEVVQEAVGGTQDPPEDPKLTNKKELSKQWKSLCKRAKQWCSMHDDSVPNFVMMYLDENRLVWEGPDHMESFISDEGVISAFLRTAALSESLIGMEKRGADDIQETAQRPAKKQKSAETASTSKKGMTDEEVIASILEKPEAESQDSTQDIGAGGDENDSDSGAGQAAEGHQPSQSTSEGPSQGGEGDVLSQVIESVIKEWAPGQGPPPRTSPGEEEGDGNALHKTMSIDGGKVKVAIHRSGSGAPKSEVPPKTEVQGKEVEASEVVTTKRHILFKSDSSPETSKKVKRGNVKCDVCQKTLKAKNMKTHMLIHSGEKPFKCGTCNRAFRHQSSLAHHANQHLVDKPFACKHCKKVLNSERSLKLHMEFHCPRNVEKDQPEHRQFCEICSKTFATKSILNRHIKECHYKDQPYGCNFCSRGFSRKDDLKKHMWLHTGEMPYTCNICDKRFRLQSNMMQHRRTHSNSSKPLICDTCGVKLTSMVKLKKHMQEHAAEPDFIVDANSTDQVPLPTTMAAETLQLLSESGQQDIETTTVTVSTLEIGADNSLANPHEIIVQAESGVHIVKAYLVPISRDDL